jgi:hypothetical protein
LLKIIEKKKWDAARSSTYDGHIYCPKPVPTIPRKDRDSPRSGFGLKHASTFMHETFNQLDSMIEAAESQQQQDAIIDLGEEEDGSPEVGQMVAGNSKNNPKKAAKKNPTGGKREIGSFGDVSDSDGSGPE